MKVTEADVSNIVKEQTMGIMTRIIKIFKADIHGVMDQLEDQGLLLKQHLRDMEEALIHKKAILHKMITSQNQAKRDHDRAKQQYDTFERDLTVAIQKDKDDIARRLIKKMKPLANLLVELSRHVETLDEEILGYREHLDQQRLQYEQIKHRSSEYLYKAQIHHWGKNSSDLIPNDLCEKMTDGEIEFELLKRKEEPST